MFKKSTSVLIIDDDSSVSLLASARLKSHDACKVYVSKNGNEGLRTLNKQKVDLILLDWVMPEMNGIEVLNIIRANKKTEHIPVIMLTGKNLIGDIEDAFEAGADDYMLKPLDLQKLSYKVKEHQVF